MDQINYFQAYRGSLFCAQTISIQVTVKGAAYPVTWATSAQWRVVGKGYLRGCDLRLLVIECRYLDTKLP